MLAPLSPKLAILQLHHVPIQADTLPRADFRPRGRRDNLGREEGEPSERFQTAAGRAQPDALGIGEGAEGAVEDARVVACLLRCGLGHAEDEARR